MGHDVGRLVTVTCFVQRVTARAVMVTPEGWTDETWLPLSELITEVDQGHVGTTVAIQMRDWLARERGLA